MQDQQLEFVVGEALPMRYGALWNAINRYVVACGGTLAGQPAAIAVMPEIEALAREAAIAGELCSPGPEGQRRRHWLLTHWPQEPAYFDDETEALAAYDLARAHSDRDVELFVTQTRIRLIDDLRVLLAWQLGEMTEGEAADALGLVRVEVREMRDGEAALGILASRRRVAPITERCL